MLVAENDDRPDDWNFLLFQRLAPGRYTLRVDPVAARAATCGRPAHAGRGGAAGRGPAVQGNDLQLGSDVLLRPLTVDPKADLLLVAARSKDSLGLSVGDDGKGRPGGRSAPRSTATLIWRCR